jgi:hypothetical protein
LIRERGHVLGLGTDNQTTPKTDQRANEGFVSDILINVVFEDQSVGHSDIGGEVKERGQNNG